MLQKWLDSVYSCTWNALPKNKYGLSINNLLLFILAYSHLGFYLSLMNFHIPILHSRFTFLPKVVSWLTSSALENCYLHQLTLSVCEFLISHTLRLISQTQPLNVLTILVRSSCPTRNPSTASALLLTDILSNNLITSLYNTFLATQGYQVILNW